MEFIVILTQKLVVACGTLDGKKNLFTQRLEVYKFGQKLCAASSQPSDEK
jgi:hypothetical protein